MYDEYDYNIKSLSPFSLTDLNKLNIKGIDKPTITITPYTDEEKTKGRKFDSNKLEYGLIPPLALKALVEVLTFGAEKYERGNWMHVPDAKRRYFDALQRHIWAWKEGEQIDPESGKHHLAHAMCCLAFLYEHDVKYSVDK